MKPTDEPRGCSCGQTECGFYPEGDNCYHWRHKTKDKPCGATKDFLLLTQPFWDKKK